MQEIFALMAAEVHRLYSFFTAMHLEVYELDIGKNDRTNQQQRLYATNL